MSLFASSRNRQIPTVATASGLLGGESSKLINVLRSESNPTSYTAHPLLGGNSTEPLLARLQHSSALLPSRFDLDAAATAAQFHEHFAGFCPQENQSAISALFGRKGTSDSFERQGSSVVGDNARTIQLLGMLRKVQQHEVKVFRSPEFYWTKTPAEVINSNWARRWRNMVPVRQDSNVNSAVTEGSSAMEDRTGSAIVRNCKPNRSDANQFQVLSFLERDGINMLRKFDVHGSARSKSYSSHITRLSAFNPSRKIGKVKADIRKRAVHRNSRNMLFPSILEARLERV